MAKLHVIDDEEFDLRALEAVLKSWGHEVVTSLSAEEGLPKIRSAMPDALITDVHLPGMDGFELCRRLREDPSTKDLPVVFITAWNTDEGSVVKGLAFAPSDYIIKPVRMTELNARLTALLRSRESMEHIRQISLSDPLTGLPNRRMLVRRLTEEISRSRRNGIALGVLMMDLDHFKQVNDTYGHPAGDQVLAHVARVLRESTRKEDILARYGGEEFAAVIWPTNSETLEVVGERLRGAVAAHPVRVRDAMLQITMSVGGFLCPGSSSVLTPDQAISAGDRALYQAKQQGRNRVVVTSETGDKALCQAQ